MRGDLRHVNLGLNAGGAARQISNDTFLGGRRMRLHSIRIRDFRCLTGDGGADGGWSFQWIPNDSLNLIIGSNAVGKTTLVDAIELVLDSDGRANQWLITEYDFPYCDTSRQIAIEASLVGLGDNIPEFESDIEWVQRDTGQLADSIEVPDDEKHLRCVRVQFRAWYDSEMGRMEWCWILPKHPVTPSEEPKKLTRKQHNLINFYRVRAHTTPTDYTLGKYSRFGKQVRRFGYRPGRFPEMVIGKQIMGKCSAAASECTTCLEREACSQWKGKANANRDSEETANPFGGFMRELNSDARHILGNYDHNDCDLSVGPRFGTREDYLRGVTLGYRSTENADGFIPFGRLSSGEQYALSYAIGASSVRGSQPGMLIMDEPETSLHPAAISSLMTRLQSPSSEDRPQVFVSSHSESVIKCFGLQHVTLLRSDDNQIKANDFDSITAESKLAAKHFSFVMAPGGASAFFADKVIVVEGPLEALTFGRLDRMVAQMPRETGDAPKTLAATGWTVFATGGTGSLGEVAAALSALGKKVVILMDSDAQDEIDKLALGYPVVTYKDKGMQYDTNTLALEEALLLGLPREKQNFVISELCHPNARRNCGIRSKCADSRCWRFVKSGSKCPAKQSASEIKSDVIDQCISVYEEQMKVPPAFDQLVDSLDKIAPGRPTYLIVDGYEPAVDNAEEEFSHESRLG